MKGFNDAFKLLPAVIQPRFKIRIMGACHWNIQQWARKKSGAVCLHPLEQKLIKQELAQYNIEAETAQYINPSEMPKAYTKGIERRA